MGQDSTTEERAILAALDRALARAPVRAVIEDIVERVEARLAADSGALLVASRFCSKPMEATCRR